MHEHELQIVDVRMFYPLLDCVEVDGVKLIAVVYRFSHAKQNKQSDTMETKGLNLFLTTVSPGIRALCPGTHGAHIHL